MTDRLLLHKYYTLTHKMNVTMFKEVFVVPVAYCNDDGVVIS